MDVKQREVVSAAVLMVVLFALVVLLVIAGAGH